MEGSGGGKHFILVHGLCHGAWCWYKLVPMLRAAGHRVTALDMAASGAHPARMDEVESFKDYSRPLLDAVAAAPAGERLVLVGHSLGGLNLALAMERFPRKVAAALFLAACMVCAGRHMGVTIEEFSRRTPSDFFMDSKIMVLNTYQGPRPAVALGPKLLAAKLYDRSSVEDQTLATMLVRPGCQFRGRPDDEGRGSAHRRQLRVGEEGVRCAHGRRFHLRGDAVLDGRPEPGHGGRGARRSRPHGHVLQAQGTL
ncbi:unnamed protein product [Triticum turgidum subsp. durum]|uniref:AB hydrolase-1 domain-containing protein n=1 Tax=Triticum turgidum subsp. durum TaxID=4567 RepID=A0A9R1QVH0_TRITD|nr:unnamed protein product [Triticum turgidum subsp. durum]